MQVVTGAAAGAKEGGVQRGLRQGVRQGGVRAAAATLVLALTLAGGVPAALAGHGADTRLGASADPVLAAVGISQGSFAPGTASHVVIGRNDVFADTLGGAALAGTGGPILYTTAGPAATLRAEVRDELVRVLGPAQGCGGGTEVYILGGVNAVSSAAEQEIGGLGYCVKRVAGASRVETALQVAEIVIARKPGPVQNMMIARADDWADAATGSAFAAASGIAIVVTDKGSMHPAVREFLNRVRPVLIDLLGGAGALSAEVEAAATQYGRTRRISGSARDVTATAIARALWGVRQGGDATRPHGVMVVNGYAPTGWAYAIAGAVPAAQRRTPQIYAQADSLSESTRQFLSSFAYEFVIGAGPAELVGDAVLADAKALGPVATASPAALASADLVKRVNDERAARGLPALTRDSAMDCHAKESADGGVRDTPNTAACEQWAGRVEVWDQWLMSGLNSQAGSDRIHVNSMGQARYPALIFQPGFDRIGVGVACSADGREMYATFIFARADGSTAPAYQEHFTASGTPIARADAPGARCDES